jgi:hypothetical protein
MMNIYIGNYWVPFPRSEYGGTWTVIAENEAQCAELLKDDAYEDEYDYLIVEAVSTSKRFGLTGDPAPMVLDTFYT